MNWNQLHTSSSPEERLDAVLLILRTIEERKQRLVFARGRLVREKRGNFPGAHFLNDRRRLRHSPQRTINRASFVFILTVMSVATWIFTMHAPGRLAAAALIIHTLLLWMILIKPYTIRLQPT
jgi:hypothetical protein